MIRAFLPALTLLLAACGHANMADSNLADRSKPPAGLNLSLEQVSKVGHYTVALTPEPATGPVGKIHRWTVDIRDQGGARVSALSIKVDGGMPQHGHGLPTAPKVTRQLDDGRWLIEGVKFNMPGWWVIDLTIEGPAGMDTIRFNYVL